jgi:hypothetical protein
VVRTRRAFVPAGWLLAVLAAGSEGGHLAAIFIEWPTSTARGVLHTTIAAGQGLVAVAVYAGPTRRHLLLALALNVLAPAAWIAGVYQGFPVLAGAAVTAVEAMLAGLLAVALTQRGV